VRLIGIVDYGVGNLFSLRRAFETLGYRTERATCARSLDTYDHIVLPGVGAFGVAANRLHETGMGEAVREQALDGKRVTGICLGMQLLADSSVEFGCHEGLSLIPGEVIEIPKSNAAHAIRIPNIGWRKLEHRDDAQWQSMSGNDGTYAYFVHSYRFVTRDEEDTVAWTVINGVRVAGVVIRANIDGFQFHPEKSGPAGLSMLQRIVEREL